MQVEKGSSNLFDRNGRHALQLCVSAGKAPTRSFCFAIFQFKYNIYLAHVNKLSG